MMPCPESAASGTPARYLICSGSHLAVRHLWGRCAESRPASFSLALMLGTQQLNFPSVDSSAHVGGFGLARRFGHAFTVTAW